MRPKHERAFRFPHAPHQPARGSSPTTQTLVVLNRRLQSLIAAINPKCPGFISFIARLLNFLTSPDNSLETLPRLSYRQRFECIKATVTESVRA
jgi:hypothetical protein